MSGVKNMDLHIYQQRDGRWGYRATWGVRDVATGGGASSPMAAAALAVMDVERDGCPICGAP